VTEDLRDLAGRAWRLLISLVAGIAAGALGWRAAAQLHLGHDDTGMREWGLLWFAVAAGLSCFTIATALQHRLARSRWRAERFPRARARQLTTP